MKKIYFLVIQIKKNSKNNILCPEMETINGTLLYKYMINVSFKDQYEQEISFDENGDPPAWYLKYLK